MQLHWSDRQYDLRAEYADIAHKANARMTRERPAAFDSQTWDALVAAGLWRLVVPIEYGGSGRHWWDFTAALEGLAMTIRSPAILLSIIAQAGMVRAIDLLGARQQKHDYFKRILDGALSATAIADPDTGTDVRATSTVLTPGPNETFVLDGAKYNIAHAPNADFVLVVCKLSGHDRDGTALVLVNGSKQGLRRGPQNLKIGVTDLPTGGLEFDGVKLHYGDLLGVPGEGLRNLVSIVSLGRLYYGLIASWLIEPMLANAMDYVRERRTFEAPIMDHQYIQKKLTDMRIGVECARFVSYGALDQLLTGMPEAAMTCSVAKLAGAESVVSGALDLVKLYGSRGYHEGRITAFLDDALAFCSVGGTEEMHRRNIFGQMVRLHGKARKAEAALTTPRAAVSA